MSHIRLTKTDGAPMLINVAHILLVTLEPYEAPNNGSSAATTTPVTLVETTNGHQFHVVEPLEFIAAMMLPPYITWQSPT